MLSDERSEVVHLAQRDALLAQDVVSGDKVEEQVRDGIAGDVGMAGELSILARPQADGDEVANSLVDDFFVSLGQKLLDLVDSFVKVVKGLEVILELLRLGASAASHHLLSNIRDNMNLEAQGQHVLVDAGIREASSVGSSLGLLEDCLQRGKIILGSGDGAVVKSV